MADALTTTESTVTSAAVLSSGVWGQLLASVLAVAVPIVLAWLTAQRDAPTVVKDPAHDPAEDQYDKEYAAAVAAGRA